MVWKNMASNARGAFLLCGGPLLVPKPVFPFCSRNINFVGVRRFAKKRSGISRFRVWEMPPPKVPNFHFIGHANLIGREGRSFEFHVIFKWF